MDNLINRAAHPFAAIHPPIDSRSKALSEAVRQLLAKPLDAFNKPEQATEPVTYAGLVLDESGSMARHRSAALEGYNSQVVIIKEGAKSAGKTLVSLTKFSSQARPVLVARPAEELQPLQDAEYLPSGSTALFDAIGLTIEQLLEQPAVHAATTAVLVSVFTDGEENCSVRYDSTTLKQLISRLEATGRWTFTLMGPQGTSLELASILNISRGNVAMFDPQSQDSTREAFSTMAGAASSYMEMRSKGITSSASLYSDLEPK